MSDILDDLDSPWPADYALQPKNSSERYDVIHAQEVKRQAAAEIRQLREQVAALTKERDDWKSTAEAHKENFDRLAGALRMENAALAEQNEKFRVALENAKDSLWNYAAKSAAMRADAALSLPDIATPALNRIRVDGMRMAAEICESVEVPIDIEVWLGTKKALTSATAIGLATTIRARADELTKEVKP